MSTRPIAMRDAFLDRVCRAMADDTDIYFTCGDFGSPVLVKAEVTGPLFPVTGLDRGYDQYHRRERHWYLDTGWGDKVIATLGGQRLDEPWFMFLHLWELHWPRKAKGEFASAKYGGQLYQRSVAYLDSQLPRILGAIDPENTIVVDLENEHFAKLIVEVEDPEATVRLLQEHARSDRISLRAFYIRRARRLLPLTHGRESERLSPAASKTGIPSFAAASRSSERSPGSLNMRTFTSSSRARSSARRSCVTAATSAAAASVPSAAPSRPAPRSATPNSQTSSSLSESRSGSRSVARSRRFTAAGVRMPARNSDGRYAVGAAAEGLLEVVADELVRLTDEPVGETLVEIRALALRQRRIGDVADQDVVEPEAAVARGTDESPADERCKVDVELALDVRRRDGGESGARELASDGGGTLEQPALTGREPVETTGQQELERWRYRAELPFFCRVGEKLLGVERVSLGELGDAGAQRICLAVVARERVEEVARVLRLERREPQCRPAGAFVEQVGPSEADDEQGGTDDVAPEVLGEVEQGRLRPVDVHEDKHERPLQRDPLEVPAQHEELLTRRVGSVEHGREFSSALGNHLADR